MSARVLVTGATGCIGRALAAAATAAGDDVVGLARTARPGPWQQCLAVDVTDADALRAAVAAVRPDVVFHAAGRLRGSAAELIAANATPVPALLEALHHASPRARFVLLGSVAEYGAGPADGSAVTESWPPAPDRPYGVSKQLATQLACVHGDRLGITVRVARLANVIGPGLSAELVLGALAAELAACHHAGRPFRVALGDPGVARDWIDVADVSRGLLALARHRGPERVFHLASGRTTTLGEVVATWANVLGAPIAVDVAAGHEATGPRVLRLDVEAAARALSFRADVPLAVSLHRLWTATVAHAAEGV